MIRHEYIEVPSFERALKSLCGSEEEESEIKNIVAKNRIYGARLCKKDIRKIRVPLKSKGKRGGGRVIYFFTDLQTEIIIFLAIYAKADKDNLTSSELGVFEKTVDEILKDFRRKK